MKSQNFSNIQPINSNQQQNNDLGSFSGASDNYFLLMI